MGLPKAVLKILLNEAKRRPFTGRVLTLGKQDIHFTREDLTQIAGEFGITLKPITDAAFAPKTDASGKQRLSPQFVFKSLGFAHYQAMDYSDFEQAEIIFDLNKSAVPSEFVGAFDVILDSGTLEHVFHVPNLLNNIFCMLRPGGRIIHITPSSNYVDHGFYSVSPTLYWDFYTTNRFEVNAVNLIRHTVRSHNQSWELMNYTPGCLDRVNYGGLDGAMYLANCIATKTESSTGNLVPQQGIYVQEWEVANKAARKDKSQASRSRAYRFISEGYQSTRPARHAVIRTLKRAYRRSPLARLGLKATAKY